MRSTRDGSRYRSARRECNVVCAVSCWQLVDSTHPLPLWPVAIDSSAGGTRSGSVQTAGEAITERAVGESNVCDRTGSAVTSTTRDAQRARERGKLAQTCDHARERERDSDRLDPLSRLVPPRRLRIRLSGPSDACVGSALRDSRWTRCRRCKCCRSVSWAPSPSSSRGRAARQWISSRCRRTTRPA